MSISARRCTARMTCLSTCFCYFRNKSSLHLTPKTLKHGRSFISGLDNIFAVISTAIRFCFSIFAKTMFFLSFQIIRCLGDGIFFVSCSLQTITWSGKLLSDVLGVLFFCYYYTVCRSRTNKQKVWNETKILCQNDKYSLGLRSRRWNRVFSLVFFPPLLWMRLLFFSFPDCTAPWCIFWFSISQQIAEVGLYFS